MARIADSASQLCGGRAIFAGPPEAVAEHYRQHHCEYCNRRACRDDQAA